MESHLHSEGHMRQKIIQFLLISLLLFVWLSGNATAQESNTSQNWIGIGKGLTYESTYIDINSIPSGAQIWINGKDESKVTPSRVIFGDRGNYTLWLILDGYQTYDEILDVSVLAGSTITRTLTTKSSIGDYSGKVYRRRSDAVFSITPTPTTPTPTTPTPTTPTPITPTPTTPTPTTPTPTTPTPITPTPITPTPITPTPITPTPTTPIPTTPIPTTPTPTTPTITVTSIPMPKPTAIQMLFQIRSNPDGAQIWIDGEFTGKLTPNIIYFDRSGNHVYELLLNGYQTYQESVYISDSITKEVTLIPLQTTKPSILSYIIELIRRVFAFQS